MNNIKERDRLFVDNKDLADDIAVRKKKSCVRSVQLSELKSAAYMGLLDAATRYDENRGCKFQSYAKYRIYGEINDYLRNYYGTRKTNPMRSWSLDVPTYTNNFNDTSPLSEIAGHDDSNITKVSNNDSFNKLTECLPKLYKNIIILHYFEGVTLREISHILMVSESRISQIVDCSLKIMRAHCNDNPDIFEPIVRRNVNFLTTIKKKGE